MDSHPADHCSFADNHPDTTLFEVAQIAAPDGSQNKVMPQREGYVGSAPLTVRSPVSFAATD